ncbi:flagellar FliJ family protein [Caenispirillum bisanense]|uniref:Flagellar FliJ protein n=1 Tax=Caenispirillum bisanense TaxID=414052 RepID=A0A286GKG4_9PROT|nr:flagellar FliJ family protein [Caenispirillum bisanense]SOD96025.1 flagellar export protein FliJ [Caenispirillum bisanense]
MAKGLHSVIRLHKWTVDEKRRALGQLQSQEEQILRMQRELQEELAREQALARQDVTFAMAFGRYLPRYVARRDALARALVDIRRRIDKARQDLAEAFLDLKTFEITQASRDLAEKRERDRKEQERMDEIGLTLHRRREQQRKDGGF